MVSFFSSGRGTNPAKNKKRTIPPGASLRSDAPRLNAGPVADRRRSPGSLDAAAPDADALHMSYKPMHDMNADAIIRHCYEVPKEMYHKKVSKHIEIPLCL